MKMNPGRVSVPSLIKSHVVEMIRIGFPGARLYQVYKGTEPLRRKKLGTNTNGPAHR